MRIKYFRCVTHWDFSCFNPIVLLSKQAKSLFIFREEKNLFHFHLQALQHYQQYTVSAFVSKNGCSWVKRKVASKTLTVTSWRGWHVWLWWRTTVLSLHKYNAGIWGGGWFHVNTFQITDKMIENYTHIEMESCNVTVGLVTSQALRLAKSHW